MSGAGSHQPIGLTIGSVVFAGGGTGGHIFPALAIAEAIGALPEGQSIRRVMIGSDKDLDRALLKAATERGELENTAGIPARPFGVRPKQAWRLISTWGTCVRETRMLLRDERERTNTPPVLVAMGGYVRAAPVKAALAEKCPVVLVNLDAVHGKANRWIAARAGRRPGVAVSSGTAGLHLVLLALGIGPGDEVVTTPFSFIASANCILMAGATPVFVDICPTSLNLDPAKVEAAFSPKT